MPLRSTNTFPPGGFLYTEKTTGFKVNGMMPFGTVVSELVRHREANHLPRATREEASEDIQEFNCKRLGNDARYCTNGQKKNSTEASLSISPGHLKNRVLHALKDASKIGKGMEILSDWVGEGMRPVTSALSQSRATACIAGNAGTVCPFNKPGSRLTESIAEQIKIQMEKKSEIKVSVEGEEKLHTCQLCLCHLPLKIHVPLKTILNRTPDAMLESFKENAPWCWMNTEQKNPATK